jgi:uncharacterized protein
MKKIFRSLALLIERLPWLMVGAALILSVGAVPGIITLRTDSGMNSLVSAKSDLKSNTLVYQQQFGGEPVTVLLQGQVLDIFSTSNLNTLNALEEDLYQIRGIRAVYSPLSLVDQAIVHTRLQIRYLQDQIDLTNDDAAAQAMAKLIQVGEPSINNPNFISFALLEQDGSINPAMSALLPDTQHAIVSITPEGNQTDTAATQTIKDIEEAFQKHRLDNTSFSIVSSTQIVNAISLSMKNDMALLLGLAVVVMIVILFILFRVRWRLLSLLLVGVGVLWTFGVMGYISIPLSMATMAVLPILVGLGIDYPIQFHNRYLEEIQRNRSAREAIVATISRMAPAVGVASLSTIIGFVTLYVSDVPMIRDFGTLLAVGIALCFIVALFVLSSVLYLKDRRAPNSKWEDKSAGTPGRVEKILRRVSAFSINKPALVIGLAIIFGLAGGILDHWIPVNTDYEELIPQNLTPLKDMRELRSVLGVSGQIHFLLEAEDVLDPGVLTQLKNYQDRELSLHAGLASPGGLVYLLSQANGGSLPVEKTTAQSIISSLPPQVSSQVISSDHKMASISFGIKAMSLSDMNALVADLQEDADKFAGATLKAAGSLALGAGMVDSVVGNRFIMDILCLGAIFITLLLIYRRLSRALFIILPVGAVIGWSSLLMFILRVPLNPLTAILGVLTTAIGTEFMVLLASRYEEEKSLGQPPREAMLTAATKMGRAIVITGVTTLGGFGVLTASNFVMIQNFGIITLVGIFLCVISSIIVMPALMVWFDERKYPNSAKIARSVH